MPRCQIHENLKNAIELIAISKNEGQELVEELHLKLNPGAKDEIERKKISNEATALINELKEKIRLLESRIEVLKIIESKLPIELKKIYKTISKMKTIPKSTEYEDYIINILRRYKINFFEKDKDTNKHPIIKEINSEKAQVEDKLKKLKSEVIEQEKERKAQVDIMKARGQGNNAIPTVYVQPPSFSGGGSEREEQLKKDLKLDTESLKAKHKDYDNFVSRDDTNTNNLHYFMKELKENVEHLENEDGQDNGAGNNKIDSSHEKGIYEDIWYDYRDAVNKPTNKGAEKYINDLELAINNAATQAAPKTADIFLKAIEKMSINDATKILNGQNNAATTYFKSNTLSDLKALISPIVKESISNNQVASYYQSFNSFYKSNLKAYVENNSVMSYAKSFGVDSYLPGNSDENLDEYITNKAIDGLFVMIEKEEKAIRENPVERTTSLLKQVFGN